MVSVLPVLRIEAGRLVLIVSEWRLEAVLKISGTLRERAADLTTVVLRLKRQILRRPLLRTVSMLLVRCQWRLIVEIDALRVRLRSVEVTHSASIFLRFLLI